MDRLTNPGRFKAETLQRLLDWRAMHGLGSYTVLALHSRGKLTDTDLRNMQIGDCPVSFAKWVALADTLDKIKDV